MGAQTAHAQHDGAVPEAFAALLGAAALTALAWVALLRRQARRHRDVAPRRENYETVFADALVGMVIARPAGDHLLAHQANRAARQLLGTVDADDGEAGQFDLAGVLAPPAAAELLRACREVVDGERNGWRGELALVDGEAPTWAEITVVALRGSTAASPGQPPVDAVEREHRCVSIVLVDTTVRREVEDRLTTLALYDGLTGLPNRTLLTDRLRQLLRVAAREGHLVGLLLVDLDDFKRLNDAHGHTVGDAVLVEVAARLAGAVRPGDTVARFGGDEFVVLCPNLPDVDTASALAERLATELEPPIEFEYRHYTTSGSVGIAVGDAHSSADTLLRDADEAMYATKSMGRRRTTFFADEHRWRAVRTVQLERALQQAVRNDELLLHVQPLIDLHSGRIVAGETLVRWQHPDRGLLLPGEWLDVAEQSSLVHDVGDWVLRESCRLGAQWIEAVGPGAPAVHVNVSARQLERGDLCDAVEELCDELGLPCDKLVLELTETELGEISRSRVEELLTLTQRGVLLAVDDFGIGYSPLTRVTELPVAMLKIDGQVVRELDTDPRAATLVRAVVGVGRSLDLQVVAEGVETPSQAKTVGELGCSTGQGYLWSPPRPPESFLTQMRTQRRSGAGSADASLPPEPDTTRPVAREH